jgi:hypothetical protein
VNPVEVRKKRTTRLTTTMHIARTTLNVNEKGAIKLDINKRPPINKIAPSLDENPKNRFGSSNFGGTGFIRSSSKMLNAHQV